MKKLLLLIALVLLVTGCYSVVPDGCCENNDGLTDIERGWMPADNEKGWVVVE